MFFAILNVLFVLAEAVIAFVEGSFNHAQLGAKSLPWLNHGGSWADLILITIILGLIQPHATSWNRSDVFVYGGISIFISVVCHVLWAVTMPIPSHIIDPAGVGLGKLPVDGYFHLIYMVLILTPILLFYFATPGVNRFWVSVLLTIFVIPAMIQPGYYAHKMVSGTGKIDLPTWVIAIAMWAIIWGIGYRRP